MGYDIMLCSLGAAAVASLSHIEGGGGGIFAQNNFFFF